MTLFKRILVSLPIALGMGLFMSSVSALLDAYEASEVYRARTDSIIDGYTKQGQFPTTDVEERIELTSELFHLRFKMEHGSFDSMRLRVFGGLLMVAVGAWIAHRSKHWCANQDAKQASGSIRRIAEQVMPPNGP